MRFRTTKKLLYQRSNKYLHVLLCSFLILYSSQKLRAQSNSFQFKNATVSHALLEVAKRNNLRISFDNTSLDAYTFSGEIPNNNTKETLDSLLSGTGYYTEFKHNTWLILKLNKETPEITRTRILGIIYDFETEERLPYASVFIINKNQFLPATVEGTFSTQVSGLNQLQLQVKYLGYHTLDTLITISSTNETLSLGLKLKTQNIAAVEVEANNLEMLDFNNSAGNIKLNPRQFVNLPNYGETDIFRSLQYLPGISAQENSAQLNIRGSSADQNLVLFDGFTLYNLDHFFGVFSAINPNVVKDIQVYRGGFDSRYGERISGIIDITGKSGNKNKATVYGGINMISANLTTEVPLAEKWTLVAAARRSYTDVYSSWLTDAILADKIGQTRRFPGADNVIEPEFYFGDFNTKLTWTPSSSENFSFSAYGGKDYLNSSNTVERDQVYIDTEDINEWGNYGFGFSWKKQHNSKYFTNLQLGHSGYFNDYLNETVFEAINEVLKVPLRADRFTDEKNDLIDYSASFKNTLFLSNSNQLEFGLSTKYNRFTFSKEAENDFIYNDLESSAMLYTAFAQDLLKLGKHLTIKPGLRLNFYDKTSKFYFEPRLAANYQLNPKLLLKMATGKYYQFLNKSGTQQSYGYNRDFWVLADGEDHPVVSSNHYIIGASFETGNLFFDLEAYYKTVEGLQEYLFFANAPTPNGPPNSPNELRPSTFISGTGDAYGIDFLAKYQYNGFTSWLSYSLSKATRNFNQINQGANIPADYDQTHEVKWTNMYTYKKWNFSTLTLYTTGHPYVEWSEMDDDFNVSRTYNRLPDYFRVDLSLNYNFNIKNFHIQPGLSVLNAFNTENYIDVYNRDFDFEIMEFNETTLVKAQELTLNFFVNFRF